MVSRASFLILVFSFGATASFAQNSVYLAYIESYKAIAISEMERTGVPASIKMAQAILESDAGRSDLARKANNHFGIKCSNDWNGDTYEKVDDDRDHHGRLIESCFRSYDSALESFMAHSDFLRSGNRRSRYAFLFDLDVTDYKAWAKGLKKAGYATSPTYHRKLIDLIERYKLYQLDTMTSEEVLAEEKPASPKEDKKESEEQPVLFPEPVSPPVVDREEPLATTMDVQNDVKNIIANRDETVDNLAEAAGIDPDRLIEYNENLHSKNQIVPAGTRVYMQPKRKNFRGRQSWHKVMKGESLMDVSIAYGIRLEDLYERNLIKPGREPVEGTAIKLRGRAVDNPPSTFDPADQQPEEPPVDPVAEDDAPVLDIEVIGNGRQSETDGVASRPDDISEDPYANPLPVPDKKTDRKEEDPSPSADPPLLPPITPERPTPKKETSVPSPADSDATATNTAPEREHEDPFGGTQTAEEEEQPATYYVVRQGDTLWSISRRYQTTVEKIKQLNKLGDDYIRRGMKLQVK